MELTNAGRGADGRVVALPAGAVNLGARITQLAKEKRRGSLLRLELLVTDDNLLLLHDGEAEYLGRWRD